MTSSFGMTTTGFVPMALPDVVSNLQANAQTIFGDLVQAGDTVDVSSDTLIGRLISLVSPSIADLWSVAQSVNDSFNPNAAVGVSEDNLFSLAGVIRKPAVASTVPVLLSGIPNTLVPQGSLVHATASATDYATVADTTISIALAEQIVAYITTVTSGHVYTVTFVPNPNATSSVVQNITYTALSTDTAAQIVIGLAANASSLYSTYFTASTSTTQIGGVATPTLILESVNKSSTYTFTVDSNMSVSTCQTPVTAQCIVTGPINDPVGSLTQIKTPVYGWNSVNNVLTGTVGQNIEDDVSYRNRFLVAKSGTSLNLDDSLLAALLALPNVIAANVYQNTTDTTGSSPPLPPHSMYAIVEGGTANAIAQTIWDNHPAGIATYGSLSGTAYDSLGNPHVMYYDTPTAVPIYISANISINSSFPSGGIALIQSALVAYAAASLSIGTEVLYSRLFTPMNTIPGFWINSMYIGTAPSPSTTTNIAIAYNQIATLVSGNIAITIT